MKQRILAILLSLTMMFTLVPTAMAEGSDPVAQIGGTTYATLKAAFEGAKDGDTITLTDDIKVEDTLVVTKTLTLDLAKHTLSNEKNIWSDDNWSLISVRGNGNLTITGNGTLKAKEDDCYPVDVQDEGAQLTIENGTFIGNIHAVYVETGAAYIKGGTYSVQQKYPDSSKADEFVLNLYDANRRNGTAKLSVSGGIFVAFNPANCQAEAQGTNFCAAGYTTSTKDNNTYTVVEGENAAVANAGANYNTLANAISSADSGDTVTLLKDTKEDITIPAGKIITLDLNGMTLTNVDDHTILNNGNLTITGTGRVDNISHAKGALYNKGTVVINGGTFDRSQENGMNKGESGQNSWYTIKNVGTMTINDGATVQTAGNNAALGKFSSLVSNGYFNTNDYNTNKGLEQPILTIDGGTFRGGLNTIKNDDRARLTINGGTFSNYYQAVVQNHNIAEITGGTFTAASDANTETYGIYNCGCGADIDLGTLTVSGGTFTGATYAVADVSSENPVVTISGGQFAGTKAAIIKSSTSNATIAISGGSFSQPVKKDYLDSSLNAELKRASGETPYSYYTSMNDALAAAKPGDTVTDLKATTELKVTLTMKYNDGATADITYNVASGTTITLPTPAHRSGYTFNGWYDGSKFYAAGASYKVSATATLNASWSYISSGSSSYDPTYSVTVDKTENGSVTVSPKSASKGSTVTITVKPDSGYVLETLTVTDKNGNELTLKDKGDGKYTFTMPAGKVEVKATFMEDNSVLNFFYDVPNDAYFYEAVKWAVKSGVTNGLTDTMFGPYESCTRAQIVTFLWRAAGSPEPKTASSFTDVPVSTYYAKAVAWAVENGITNGMTETTFAPDATCTRGQSVTFLYRALKGTASGSANFTDVKSDAFYADAINWAVANNVTNGTSNTTFSPNADCTRAEIVTFLYRAYQGK